MLKIYPKRYESVFSEFKPRHGVDLKYVKIRDFDSNEAYAEFAKKEVRQMLEDIWLINIKLCWLFFKFTYKGKRRTKTHANSVISDTAFSVFQRQSLGLDSRFFTRSGEYHKVVDYYNSLYPEFDFHDPFKEPEYFKFPYKNITMDFLVTVYQMPERLEILAYADEKAMSYNEYLDFILNYIHSYNEEYDDTIFELSMFSNHVPYVSYKFNPYFNKYKRKKLI